MLMCNNYSPITSDVLTPLADVFIRLMTYVRGDECTCRGAVSDLDASLKPISNRLLKRIVMVPCPDGVSVLALARARGHLERTTSG